MTPAGQRWTREIIGVLAGNARQYRDYLRSNGIAEKSAVHCHSAHMMRGYRFTKLVRVGTWYELPEETIEAFEYCEKFRMVERPLTPNEATE